MTDRPFLAAPAEGILRITAPTPFPGLPHVHAYLTDGADGGLVLFDTTLGWEDSLDRIERSIAFIGRAVTDIERIYLTHAHPDHTGLAKVLQDASGAEVVCHPLAEVGLDGMQNPERWEGVGRHLEAHGWVPDASSRAVFTLPKPDRLVFVEAGDEVRFAGDTWEVHHTPGHELGHVVFFRRRDRLVLVGDTLLGRITPHIGYAIDPPDPLGQFMDSLGTLEALEPAFVLPGHGRPFEDGASRSRAIANHHRARLRRCTEVIELAGRPLTGLEIAHAMFGDDLMHFRERLALAETLAHLEHLRLTGRLDRYEADGLFRYDLPDDVPG